MDIVPRRIGCVGSATRDDVWLKFALVGMLYVLGGLAGRLVALPPGYVSPIWPAAGLALAAFIVIGIRCWPGVWAGAFLLDFWLDASATGAMIAAFNASAVTAQGLCGFWLTRPYLVGSTTLALGPDLWRFLFRAGPCACLISATIGVATLNGFGRVADEEIINQWLLWWTGHTAGVLLFMPLALCVWPGAHLPWARNNAWVALPIFMTAILIAAGHFGLSRLEHTKAQREADRVKEEVYDHHFLPLPAVIESLRSVERLFAANEEVTPHQFSVFTAAVLKQPGLLALGWLPRLEATDRVAFEAALPDDSQHALGITEQAPDGGLVRAADRATYFPVQFVEPLNHNRAAVGFDFASHPSRLAGMERAQDTGQTVAIKPLPLVQSDRIGVPVFVPVYRQDLPEGAQPVEVRRAALRGFVAGSFDLKQLFAPLADEARARNLSFRVSDVSPGEVVSVLVDMLPAGAAPMWYRDLQFGGRVWRLEVNDVNDFWIPGASFEARVYLAFSVLAAFLTALVALGTAGRGAAVEALVAARTTELEHELQARQVAEAVLQHRERDLDITLHSIGDAVMATDADGRITRLNRIAERLTGWSQAEAKGRPVQEVFRIVNEETRSPAELPVVEVLRTGELRGLANHMVLISRDGQEYTIADSAAPIVDPSGTLRGVVLVFRDVTVERRAEVALAASEARYRQFIELSPFGVFVQIDGRFQFVNPRAIVLFGAESADQLVGRQVLDFVHPDSREIVGERIRSLNTGREAAATLDEVLLRVDGSTFQGEVTAVPYLFEGCNGGLVLFQDITARREAEAQRDRFFRLSLDMLCIADMDGQFKQINPAFSRGLGWSEAEILARPFMDLVHPDDLPATVNAMKQLAANDTVQNLENRYRCKDGSWRWLAWKAIPQPGGLIFATARDATERHEAERRLLQMNFELERRIDERTAALEALNAKEEEVRAVLDNLIECVIGIDDQGTVRSANPAVERVFGYQPAEITGQNVSYLMPEPHHSRHDDYLERYRRTGEAHIIGIGREVEGRHKDGHLIPLELSIAEYEVRGERFFIGTLRDISESKRLIGELTAARADAEQASRAKSAFLAAMSHEIRTPMNGVIGMVEVLANGRLSEHQSDLVRTIRESASALLGIIDDILDFSKIEAGKLEIERVPLSIADLVEGLCNSLVPVAARRGVELSLFISPDIPERVLSDDTRLRQVLYNLIGNAIKFSAGRPDQRGRVSVRVEIVTEMPLRLALRVADNGIGMTQETQSNLFAPFTQAEVSTTRRFGGTGLGLAISKRLVELLHGDIRVKSNPGAGAIFTVTLPFEIAVEQPQRELATLTGVNCILIECAELNSRDLRTYLERAAAQVSIVADDSAMAAQVAALRGPVVVIRYVDHRHPQAGSPVAALAKVHCLYITRGRRRRVRIGEHNMITLDGDALRRQALLHAVAVAAGLVSPEVFHDRDDCSYDDVAPPSVADARSLGRLVLVAEDDEINQKVILQQLALLGHAAEVAPTGVEALRMWRNGHYGLVLTDLHMPEMDGYALTEAIRREEAGQRRIPILALTANALRGEANRARAMGMDEYLTKPIQLHVLRTALEKWLPATTTAPAQSAPLAPPHPEECVTALVNVAILKELVGDDPKTVGAILRDYAASATKLAAELHGVFAEGEFHAVGAIAHKLKSSSRAVGASALGDYCAELENAARAENRSSMAQWISLFDEALSSVLKQITEIVEKKTE